MFTASNQLSYYQYLPNNMEVHIKLKKNTAVANDKKT